MAAYYNEHDSYAAAWLRNLIAAGRIAPGDVDERSIADVRPADLVGYEQCHFFAGVGGWSLALRLAGWPDDRPVWTGSCPCQPFSVAGAGRAFDDERHLWPDWFPLIAQRRPAVVFGEQVDAAIRRGWLDAVFADLEAEGYACGAAVLPACGVGAPHIRQRVWFVADANGGNASAEGLQRGGQYGQRAQDGGAGRDLADPSVSRRRPQPQWPAGAHGRPAAEPGRLRDVGGMADRNNTRLEIDRIEGIAAAARPGDMEHADGTRSPAGREATTAARHGRAAVAAMWADCDWLPCTDGKSRPVEPGTFPLAHGIPGRVGRLRAYGNAIVPQIAAEFIAAHGDATREADDPAGLFG